MGSTYFYGKIVSMFGNGTKGTGKKNMFKYMMLMEMFKGNSGNSGNSVLNMGNGNSMATMFMMSQMLGGGGTNLEDAFEGILDFDGDSEDDEVDIEEDDSDKEEE
jgi:hypothetical protein